MLRSMYTAISSLNMNQTYMDVIADNLANANTVGYKASRVSFTTQYAQMVSAGSAATTTTGGVNPTQIGLGAQIGYISTVFTQGSLESTDNNMDLAISGDGYFIYADNGTTYYSRDGSISKDSNGYLINTATGLRIQGWNVQADGTVDTSGAVGDILIPTGSTMAQATENMTIDGNLNSESAVGDTFNTTIGAYDSLGVLHSISLTFTRQDDNTWGWAAGSPATGSGTIDFDTDGQATGTTSFTIGLAGANGAADLSMTADMSNMTMLAADSDVSLSYQDGLEAGELTDVSIASETGQVYMVFSNGMTELVGQIALANFNNPSGLIRTGDNMYQIGLNSGEAQVGAAGTGGRGAVTPGYTEASNVDMAQEFTNMILAQRGFQASSRIITTSDTMLEELVNLTR